MENVTLAGSDILAKLQDTLRKFVDDPVAQRGTTVSCDAEFPQA
jgi:hypothetical protein